ncbi:Lysophospholipase L1 [Verrucomicrobium sp. GAS474]|uniref:rhamnogalacturonan acetylesterase n=1 Tax=Verrucomicrobium sp. GAS474 TaxID=1882831 RepID=UPI00087D173D|nr:rhamnogalacturonan acetylesterase [Verrucomicrobium sp. GAS474]SDU27391.1 Lysophospholipase L1 [Verrucomicrobium sp. GAS474]
MKKTLLFFLPFLALSSVLAQNEINPVEKEPTPTKRQVDPSLPTLFIVGDSTVENGNAGHVGWGEPLVSYFDLKKINVVNMAIGGRSSRSYIEEGRWAAVLSKMKAGDFLLVQFGHNDGGSPSDPKRGDRATLKGGGDDTVNAVNPKNQQEVVVHSYGWYMRQYVSDTKAKGATPIVCSLIPRKLWGSEGKIGHSTDYGAWAQDAAKAAGGLFIDLNGIIADRYNAMGKEKVDTLFADEHTHTNAAGAEINAESVVMGLKGLADNPLASFFSDKGAAVSVAPPIAEAASAPAPTASNP